MSISMKYTIFKAIETSAHVYRSFLKIATKVLSSKHDLGK